ncbi:MAG TPA: hypothetical protein VKR31_13820 [Rhizomicrobium sp.]|nr:hypothetical protein [Rhizomicrobium sp.]
MRNSLLLSVAAASLLAAGASALAGTSSWVPANVPAGGSGFTMFGINDSNVVTGDYINSSGVQEGVVGPFDGSNWTNFADSGGTTQPRALNNKGQITGFDTGTLQQWERFPSGNMKNITQGGNPVADALAMGINKFGVFAGDYTNSSGVEVGAIGQNAQYTQDIPLSISNTGYAGRAIDAKGDVAGWYYDSSGIQHGYAIVGGNTIMIDYPNAYYTVVEGMNNKGMVSGQWEDTSGVIHGFIYNIAKNKYTSLDAPGASFTQVWGINDMNTIAASAAESSGTESFAYCTRTNGCPASGAAKHTGLRPSGKPVMPQPN